MSDPTAFRATYADWKLIRTRQTVQVVFEIPLSDADAAYTVLGGMPDSAREHWFGIAPLSPTTKEVTPHSVQSIVDPKSGLDNAAPQPQSSPRQAGAKRDWRNIPPPQQAGIRCDDPVFGAFLKENYPDDWHESSEDAAECVRLICAVVTRTQLLDGAHRVIWNQLDQKFQAWKAMEHA